LGSTIALANSAGAIATQYTYEPFGNVTASGQTSANPYQFTGRENDGAGLYFYRARYYSPALQRFIAQDPIGIGGDDANLYGYVWNSPINLIDPWGLWGVGAVGGGSWEGGAGGLGGTAVTSQLGGGIFGNGSNISAGGFATAGGFSGLPGTQLAMPPGNDNMAVGGSASLGGGVFFTNARCVGDLQGPFKTHSINLFGLGIQLASGTASDGTPIWDVSVTGGWGNGISAAVFNTDTEVTPSWSLGKW
jgi:RHS repeat-associated protein